MEAHKKFSSEPFDDQIDEEQHFSNKQHRKMYNDNQYSRGHSGGRHFNDDQSRSLSQSRESQIMRNADNKYVQPNPQFSRDINQSYTQEMPALKNNEDDYFKYQNNVRNKDQGFPMGKPLQNDNDEEFSNEPIIDKNNCIPQKENYELPSKANYEFTRNGPPSRENVESLRDRPLSLGNYESPRGGLSSRGNYESSRGGLPSRDKYESRGGPFSRENYESYRGVSPPRGNFDSSRGRPSLRGNYASFRGGPPSRGHYNSSRGGALPRDNYDSFRGGPPFRGNFANNTNKPSMEWDENYTKNEEPIEYPIVPLPVKKQLYEEAKPIDPVKIFDYRHLPTLKVIPGNVTFDTFINQ